MIGSSGEEFRALIRPYLLNGLMKGIPSLFVDVRALYLDKDKRNIIEELMEGFRDKYENGESIEGTCCYAVDLGVRLHVAVAVYRLASLIVKIVN